MRLALVAALLVAGCNGCQPTSAPGPTPPISPPAPVHADAGDACASACEAAAALCDRAAVSISECATYCAEGMRQLSGPTATPRCFAAALTCSSKEWCTK